MEKETTMKLNLTLFDGGAGAGAAAGAAGSTGAAPAESTNTGVKEGSQGAAYSPRKRG